MPGQNYIRVRPYHRVAVGTPADNSLGTLFKIPSEALLLPNKTYPIKDEPGYYLGGLDVFHQLHCLVSLTGLQVPHFYNHFGTEFRPEGVTSRVLHRSP